MKWTRASLLIVSAAAAAMAQSCSRQFAAKPIAVDRRHAMQLSLAGAESGSLAGDIQG